MNAPAQPTFLWHDYETFGADTRHDRPAEFACWRTDAKFEPVAEPVSFRCRPTLDYLPEPAACAVTGIGPEAAFASGLDEPDFALAVQTQMSEAQTCTLGYNSMRFDDEITRHLFWRNFIDPYEREWARGNSRFDLIDLTRAAYALRPDGLRWPLREDGNPSFKLADLSAANALPHSHAHAALSDVEATLALGRLLRLAQPRLLDHALELRRKARVLEMLDWRQRTPLIHVSQRFPAERGCLAVVVPVALHPSQGGKVIVVDAHQDPTPLLEWTPDRLAEMVFASADTPGRVPLGLKLVHANRAPFLAPMSVLKGVDLQRIRMDRAAVDRHCDQLRSADGLDQRLQQVYRLLDQQPQTLRDVDGALYDGFIGDADRALARQFAQGDAAQRAQIAGRFSDTRLATLALRFRGRHHEAELAPLERRLWLEHCRSQLQRSGRTLADYRAATTALAAERRELADDLLRWADRLSAHAMAG